MDVYESGVIKADVELDITPINQEGFAGFAACVIVPGILTINSLDLNDKQFSIMGHWFDMDNFKFRKPK